MNTAPAERPRRAIEHLVSATASRIRRPPTSRRIARRRMAVLVGKWVLPAGALALLAMIALWPEFDRAVDQSRMALRRLGQNVDGATVVDARYRGVDERGRPYTITASVATQVGPERVNLTDPKGDIVQESGSWLMVQAQQGVFMQHANQLDLSHDVVLYRDDGTTYRTQSAAIDLKNGAAAGAEPVHAEGPFGVLDAQGFTATDKGAGMQFAGPAHLVMNAHSQ
ncbi:MAG: LPS export ABC transporter periplasmic protein LptC [Acetobacteraceae bacterium]|nr:LPS export ABC transporter periplasmic protein LptC [Acetobacteraceae bacterium]